MKFHFLFLSFLILFGCKTNASQEQDVQNLISSTNTFVESKELKEPSSDNCDLPVWKETETYAEVGTKIVYEGKIYSNKWYAKGQNPEEEGDQNPWELVAFCTAEPLGCETIKPWSSEETYHEKNQLITFNNDLYENKWHTKGDSPKDSDVWVYQGPCGGTASIATPSQNDTEEPLEETEPEEELTENTTPISINKTGKYSYGITPKNTDLSVVNESFEKWKTKYVTSKGCPKGKRVLFDDLKHTVSEGIGYGILIAAYMNDEQLVDDLLAYYKSFLNENGVMHWKIDDQGKVVGQNAATDADEDVAFGLLVAHEKINSKKGYKKEADRIINQMMKTMVEKNTYVLKPGDKWGGSNTTNPSYFAPGYFKVFAKSTGDKNWIKVSDKNYDVLFKSMNKTTGLVPDWCKADGSTPAAGVSWSKDNGTTYNYDAARTPWRIGLDVLWFGDNRGHEYCNTIASFIKKTGISSVKDSYHLNGEPKGSNHSSTFIGPFGVGVMGSNASYQTTLDDCYNENVKKKNNNYFNDTLRVLTLMAQCGVFTLPDTYKD